MLETIDECGEKSCVRRADLVDADRLEAWSRAADNRESVLEQGGIVRCGEEGEEEALVHR